MNLFWSFCRIGGLTFGGGYAMLPMLQKEVVETHKWATEQELLDYDFCLIDNSRNQLYYMKVKEPNNFIRKAFDSTTKNEIYFGKEILQNKIVEDDLIKKIKTIGK